MTKDRIEPVRGTGQSMYEEACRQLMLALFGHEAAILRAQQDAAKILDLAKDQAARIVEEASERQLLNAEKQPRAPNGGGTAVQSYEAAILRAQQDAAKILDLAKDQAARIVEEASERALLKAARIVEEASEQALLKAPPAR